jgi:hypothetical protein
MFGLPIWQGCSTLLRDDLRGGLPGWQMEAVLPALMKLNDL